MLGGCGVCHVPAETDAGPELVNDAGQLEPIDGHPITCLHDCDSGADAGQALDAGPETIDTAEACEMVANECDVACPFAGVCNAEAVAFCARELAEQGDNCVNVRAILESPECTEACE